MKKIANIFGVIGLLGIIGIIAKFYPAIFGIESSEFKRFSSDYIEIICFVSLCIYMILNSIIIYKKGK